MKRFACFESQLQQSNDFYYNILKGNLICSRHQHNWVDTASPCSSAFSRYCPIVLGHIGLLTCSFDYITKLQMKIKEAKANNTWLVVVTIKNTATNQQPVQNEQFVLVFHQMVCQPINSKERSWAFCPSAFIFADSSKTCRCRIELVQWCKFRWALSISRLSDKIPTTVDGKEGNQRQSYICWQIITIKSVQNHNRHHQCNIPHNIGVGGKKLSRRFPVGFCRC